MNRVLFAATLASAGFFSTVAIQPLLAQQPDEQAVETRADALARANARFDRIDANKDGKLTPQEFAAMRGPGRGPRGGPGEDDVPPPPPPPGVDGTTPAPPAPPSADGAGPGWRGSRMFARLDTNNDGVVDREEFRANAIRRFDRVDTNKDGKIDAEERQAARDAAFDRRGPRGNRGGNRDYTAGDDQPPPVAPDAKAGQ